MNESPSRGTVKTWYPEEGRGSLEIDGVAGGCCAHFSRIVQRKPEFLELIPREQVLVSCH